MSDSLDQVQKLQEEIAQLKRELEFMQSSEKEKLLLARKAGVEAMRVAMVQALAQLWDRAAANIAKQVQVPDTF